jgi:hypothetical protein
MRISLIAKLFLVTLVFGNFSIAGEGATIYYVPIGVETYAPITSETIRSAAQEKWVITEPSRIQQLLSILRGGTPHPFDDADVRAVIYYGDDTFFLNRAGEVKSHLGSKLINVSGFSKFYSTLRSEEKRRVNE